MGVGKTGEAILVFFSYLRSPNRLELWLAKFVLFPLFDEIDDAHRDADGGVSHVIMYVSVGEHDNKEHVIAKSLYTRALLIVAPEIVQFG